MARIGKRLKREAQMFDEQLQRARTERLQRQRNQTKRHHERLVKSELAEASGHSDERDDEPD